MKALHVLILFGLAAHVVVGATPKDRHGRSVFRLAISSQETTSDGKVSIVAAGDNDGTAVGLRLEIDLPRAETPGLPPDGLARVPVRLVSTGNESRNLDALLRTEYDLASDATLFKSLGYEGRFAVPIDVLLRDGGDLFIGDPGVEGGNTWMIAVHLMPRDSKLSLFVYVPK